MRVFCAVLAVCLLEGGALALLLVDRPARSTAIVAAAFEPPASAPRPPRTFTIVAGGDVSLAGEPRAALLAGIRPVVRDADLAIANLEGTLATGGAARCVASANEGCFVFRASPGWAPALKAAGFDAFSVANNHALDFGPAAQTETLAALKRVGLLAAGLPGRIAYVRAAGVRVALIGVAPYRWSQSLLDADGSSRLVRIAARHADVVVVYMHAGAEGADAEHVSGTDETYRGEPRGNAQAFARAMVAAGADLVFASGPHVLRGVEWYRHRLIAYSLGNLATSHTLSTAGALGRSALLRVTLDARGRFVAGSVVPLRLDVWGAPARDPSSGGISAIRALSRADFGLTAVRLGPAGTIAAP
jgi:poly-gamma-glutamate capsule biosynthesis protein CapA/YwtB (metallophosphatase superfamily)